jgi:hypothetical protein
MTRANIDRRDSLEEAYPPDAFASDAAQNGRAPAELIRGVRILSAPDAAGDFELERTTQQIGEAASTVFLAPYRREDRLVSAARDSPTTQSADPDPKEGYVSFLADIVAAAQRFGFKVDETPGRDDPRIRGLRQ